MGEKFNKFAKGVIAGGNHKDTFKCDGCGCRFKVKIKYNSMVQTPTHCSKCSTGR